MGYRDVLAIDLKSELDMASAQAVSIVFGWVFMIVV